jgi:acyl-CoA thioester hydrolase
MLLPLHTRYTDYDTKGHVNNAVYLTYFEMARAEVWREALGLPDDPEFVVGEATVRYVSPAMLGESLEVEIRTGEVRTRAWTFEYVIRCTGDGRTIAEGKTVQVWYDYAARRSAPIPDAIRGALGSIS